MKILFNIYNIKKLGLRRPILVKYFKLLAETVNGKRFCVFELILFRT